MMTFDLNCKMDGFVMNICVSESMLNSLIFLILTNDAVFVECSHNCRRMFISKPWYLVVHRYMGLKIATVRNDVAD